MGLTRKDHQGHPRPATSKSAFRAAIRRIRAGYPSPGRAEWASGAYSGPRDPARRIFMQPSHMFCRASILPSAIAPASPLSSRTFFRSGVRGEPDNLRLLASLLILGSSRIHRAVLYMGLAEGTAVLQVIGPTVRKARCKQPCERSCRNSPRRATPPPLRHPPKRCRHPVLVMETSATRPFQRPSTLDGDTISAVSGYTLPRRKPYRPSSTSTNQRMNTSKRRPGWPTRLWAPVWQQRGGTTSGRRGAAPSIERQGRAWAFKRKHRDERCAAPR